MTVHFESIAGGDEVDFTVTDFVPPERPGIFRSFGKRLFDVVLILMALPVILPVSLAIYVALRTEGGDPFFWQKRIGRHGRVFWILKFRTMVPDAEARLEAHLEANPDARAEWDRNQKLKHDPRVTALGRVLRKFSLDELPQLWNVLTGEMSLVGPRPMLPEQQAIYPGHAYYALLPGITGPWQVSERNECEFKARARFDAEYGRTMSLAGDLRILFQTVRAVYRGTGY